jgi:MraZ protein
VFLGEYQHSLDDKGRIVLPKKFRELLEDGAFVTPGQEHCLYVFTRERFEEEVARVGRLPRTDRRARNYARSFFAGAGEVSPDRQGRIQLSEKQREYASLEGDVTVVGVAERIELWSTEAWQGIAEEADEYFSTIEEVLSDGEGI